MVKIVNLKDGAHVGDDDNAKSIAQALAAKLIQRNQQILTLKKLINC
jgi:hypothetical protein